MALNAPPLTATPATVADWVEIAALANQHGTYRLSQLKRYWDTHRETEDAGPEGTHLREESTDDDGFSGEDADAFLDAVADELGDRSKALGSSYPFVLGKTSRVTLLDLGSLTAGQWVYLFCLLLSNCKKGEIFDGTWVPNVHNRVRDLFQVCSTIAAAGEISGCAISFGWPRPNNNPPFLAKLHEVYANFGEGQPVRAPRPGAETMVKDAEIDVIAWRPRPDGAAGTFYLLGQVASGDNWMEKSILPGIEYFHRTWFDRPPASPATPSIFIPHAVPPENGGSRKDRIELLTAKFGTILDRLRIPLLANLGNSLAAANAALIVERVNELGDIGTWVQEQIDALRATSSIYA